MRAEDSRLSLGDCSAFVAARDEGNSLLTGDKRLRDQAEDISLETHGVLWVLDEIEAAGLLNHAELAVSHCKRYLTKVPGCLSMNAKDVFSAGQVRSSDKGFPATHLLTNDPNGGNSQSWQHVFVGAMLASPWAGQALPLRVCHVWLRSP